MVFPNADPCALPRGPCTMLCFMLAPCPRHTRLFRSCRWGQSLGTRTLVLALLASSIVLHTDGHATQCRANVTYQTMAPTLTSSRQCTNVTNCGRGAPYQLAAPTNTTDRYCAANASAGCAALPGDTYATTLATATSDAVCAAVTNCTAAQVALEPPTPTTDRVCIMRCTPTQYIADPESRNASCQAIDVGCPGGCHETQAVPGLTNRVCSCGSHAASLNTGKIVGIVVGCILLFALSRGALVVVSRRLGANAQGAKDRRQVEEAEMQLLSARDESAASEATVRRILSAWAIPPEHLTFLQELAEGTYGAVWKGLWGSQPVAIKVLKRCADDEHGASEDFRKECEALQAIKHPNLIVFFGAGTTAEGRPFMVTELMAGGSLRVALGDPLKAIDWLVRVRIARHVADGMRHLHGVRIVHRDLKSDNVLLDGEMNAKVADFGTSQMLGAIEAVGVPATTATASASMTRAVGTQLWMAPEVFFGHSTYGPEVDVYSFGIILWELVTRKDPWCELGATDYLTQFRLLNEALEAGRRPALPTGFAAEHEVYAATMLKCWATEPAARPSFEAVVFSLSLVPAAIAASPIAPESTAAAPPRPAPHGIYATVDGARSATERTSASRSAIYE